MSFAVESRHGDSSPVTPVEDQAPTPRRRRVGPRSKLVLHAHYIEQWLRENPELPTVEILSRVRLGGYHGGKSALYELVRRLRVQRPVNRARSA